MNIEDRITAIRSKMGHFNLASYDNKNYFHEKYILSNRNGDGFCLHPREYIFYGNDFISLVDKAYDYFTNEPSKEIVELISTTNSKFLSLQLKYHKYIECAMLGDVFVIFLKMLQVHQHVEDGESPLFTSSMFASICLEEGNEERLLSKTIDDIKNTNNIDGYKIYADYAT